MNENFQVNKINTQIGNPTLTKSYQRMLRNVISGKKNLKDTLPFNQPSPLYFQNQTPANVYQAISRDI